MVPMIEESKKQKDEEVHQLIQPENSPAQNDDCAEDSQAQEIVIPMTNAEYGQIQLEASYIEEDKAPLTEANAIEETKTSLSYTPVLMPHQFLIDQESQQ